MLWLTDILPNEEEKDKTGGDLGQPQDQLYQFFKIVKVLEERESTKKINDVTEEFILICQNFNYEYLVSGEGAEIFLENKQDVTRL